MAYSSPLALKMAIGVPSTTTRSAAPGATSSSWPTTTTPIRNSLSLRIACLVYVVRADAALDDRSHGLLETRNRHLLDERIHEALDNEAGGGLAREAATHQVEDLLLVHLADRRAVRAANDIVAADLQVRDRV